MKALILFDRVHEIIAPWNPAHDTPLENWSPTPVAFPEIPEDILPHIKEGTLWDATTNFFDLEDVRRGVVETNTKQFMENFELIDKRAVRPSQDILARQVEIDAAPVGDARSALEAQNVVDKNVLVGLRQLTEQNRQLLTSLKEATTWQQAALIVPVKPEHNNLVATATPSKK